jgi:hypothetical protein
MRQARIVFFSFDRVDCLTRNAELIGQFALRPVLQFAQWNCIEDILSAVAWNHRKLYPQLKHKCRVSLPMQRSHAGAGMAERATHKKVGTNGVALICTGSNMNRNIFYIIGVIVVIIIVLKMLGLF